MASTCTLRVLYYRRFKSVSPLQHRGRPYMTMPFRDIKTLQKFASIHASIYNHFNHQRHLNRRDTFKQARATALAEWRQLAP